MFTVELSTHELTQLYRGMMESVDKLHRIVHERKQECLDFAFWAGVADERRNAVRTLLQRAINAGFEANADVLTELDLTPRPVRITAIP